MTGPTLIRHRSRSIGTRTVAGLTLIELMVALLLGLLVVGGALSVFSSNRQTYRATDNLGKVQENARIAFELMARDLREAGGNPCDEELAITSDLAAGSWWDDLTNRLQGYDAGALAGSAAGTDAVELKAATAAAVTATVYNPGSRQFTVDSADHGIQVGDYIMVCGFLANDSQWAGIAQVTSLPATNQIVHATVAGWPTLGTLDIDRDVVISRYQAHRWFVADNPAPRTNRSLYEVVLQNGVPTAAQEVAEGVQDMQVTYLQNGQAAYVDAAAVTDWDAVIAARILLTLESTENVSTTIGQPIQRTVQYVVTLRNRVT